MVGSLNTEIQRPLPHLKWLPRGATNLRVGGLVFRREYSGGQFDDYNYGIYAGPRILTNRGHYSVLFQADRRGVNGSPYSRQYGLQLEGVRMVLPRIWAGGSVELSRQTALSLGGPVGKPGFSWNSQAFVNYTILPSLTMRFMGGSGRENTDRVSTRHRSKWVGVLGSYDLPLGFTLTAARSSCSLHSSSSPWHCSGPHHRTPGCGSPGFKSITGCSRSGDSLRRCPSFARTGLRT